MTRCRLCRIEDTADVYRVCDTCRAKAADGWPGYAQHIRRIESPAPRQVSHEPTDAEFIEMMGWKETP
jgi:hypothetical protein